VTSLHLSPTTQGGLSVGPYFIGIIYKILTNLLHNEQTIKQTVAKIQIEGEKS
jgi:hypothetical protein